LLLEVADYRGVSSRVLRSETGGGPRDEFRDAIAPLVNHLDRRSALIEPSGRRTYPMDKPNTSLTDTIWALRQILPTASTKTGCFATMRAGSTASKCTGR